MHGVCVRASSYKVMRQQKSSSSQTVCAARGWSKKKMPLSWFKEPHPEIHCFVNFTDLPFYVTCFISKKGTEVLLFKISSLIKESLLLMLATENTFTEPTCIFNQVVTAPWWPLTPLTSCFQGRFALSLERIYFRSHLGRPEIKAGF